MNDRQNICRRAGRVRAMVVSLVWAWSVCPLLAQQADAPVRLVCVVAEHEYKTLESLQNFHKKHLESRGFTARWITAPDDGPGQHDLAGLEEALKQADCVVLSVRRRAPKPAQLDALKKHLASGKPLVAIRTSSHAFHLRGKPAPEGHALWETFDPDVLGGNYHNHYGDEAFRITVADGAQGHAILNEVRLESGRRLYRSGPLRPGVQMLLAGTIEGKAPEPLAWVNRYGENKARIFYTSLGAVEDFAQPGFQRLLLNALYWGLDQSVLNAAVNARPAGADLRAEVLRPGAKENSLRVAVDLGVDRVLTDPVIANPLHLTFDERGRL